MNKKYKPKKKTKKTKAKEEREELIKKKNEILHDIKRLSKASTLLTDEADRLHKDVSEFFDEVIKWIYQKIF